MLPRPLIAVPGETPRSPVMVVGPVFVTAEAPSTAKLAALPRLSPRRGAAHSMSANPIKMGGVDLRSFIVSLLGEHDSLSDSARREEEMLFNSGQTAGVLFQQAGRAPESPKPTMILAATVGSAFPIICLDTYIRLLAYSRYGIRVRHHCRAKPPRDTQPAGLLATIGGRDRASTSNVAAGGVKASASAA